MNGSDSILNIECRDPQEDSAVGDAQKSGVAPGTDTETTNQTAHADIANEENSVTDGANIPINGIDYSTIDETPYEHGFEPGDHIIRWDMLPILWPIQIHGQSHTYYCFMEDC